MNHTEFAVTRFENRNGVTSWRVTGTLCCVRIRKNFKTKEGSCGEKAALELKAAQATSGQHSVTTHLTHDQIREAEAAFRQLEGKPHTLLFRAAYVVANYLAREREAPRKLQSFSNRVIFWLSVYLQRPERIPKNFGRISCFWLR